MCRISTIELYYRIKNGFFYGLKFYDKSGSCIFSAGDTKDSGLKANLKIELKEGDHIVGCKSRLDVEKGDTVCHDFRLLIASKL